MNTPAAPRNILIVRVSSLGDVVHNMPMVADLRRHFPTAHIDWVVEEAYAPLVRLNRGVSNVLPFALRRWRRSLLSTATRAEMAQFRRSLRAVAYDLVLDTQGLFKTAVVMRMARLAPGGQRVGLANATVGSGYEPISRIFHTRSIGVGLHAHAVERARLVAAGALGYALSTPDARYMPEQADTLPTLDTPHTPDTPNAPNAPNASNAPERLPGDARTLVPDVDFCLDAPALSATAAAWLPASPYAVFFHGTARAAKQWPAPHWIAIGRMLAQAGVPVLLPWGSQAELVAARHLADNIPGATVLPHLPMMDAVLLAQRAALVIGLDTGLTHIAAAYARPTIELYCDSPRWKTEGNWSPAIINLGDTGAPPSVQQVHAAVERLLKTA